MESGRIDAVLSSGCFGWNLEVEEEGVAGLSRLEKVTLLEDVKESLNFNGNRFLLALFRVSPCHTMGISLLTPPPKEEGCL